MVSSLEGAIIRAAENSRAKVRAQHRFITASFDEHVIGLGLDLVLVLEAVLQALRKAASDLYGYACILGQDIAEEGPVLLRKASRSGAGIWCSEPLRRILEPYAVFDAPPEDVQLSAYGRLRELKTLPPRLDSENFPCLEEILSALNPQDGRSAVLMGPGFIGKREALSRFTRAILGDFPPLVFVFGAGGTGLSCITDALTPAIRELIPPKRLEILDTIGAFIFKERLEDEFSPFTAQKAGRFLNILLSTYIGTALSRGISPVILLENIHLANPAAARVFIDIYSCPVNFEVADVYLYGTCLDGPEPTPSLGIWEAVFSRILRFSSVLPQVSQGSGIPKDLWEIAYGVSLFRRYFPPSLFLRLFEEEGKNPGMISRALDMISSQGLITVLEEDSLGEGNLGTGKERIQRMVRNRLLAWVSSGKLRPGFKLLQALADLGEIASEELVLEALRKDLINGTCRNLRRAIEESRLEEIAGPSHLPSLFYIWRTFESLLRGDAGDIKTAFGEPPPEEETPSYKVLILSLLAAYMLGIRDTNKASDLIKEVMLICHGRSGIRGLAQAYRLFALANLCKGRFDDAIDYLSFAMEQAEKSEDFEEYALSAYYAAAVQFLFGNIAKAERLAFKSEELALQVGLSAWGDRIKLLRGKLLFESGRYKESLNMFVDLRYNPAGVLPAAAADVIEAWIYRSAVFLGSGRIPIPERRGPDARFFEIEASYLAEDYQRTVELSEKFLGEMPDQDFLFIEQPDWRSGFSQGELLLFSLKEFWAPMIATYRALALCRLDREGRDDARRSIERIIQDERFSDTDPNSAFYFFAYYRILGESGAVEVDMDTAISMAYNRLQRRASRIDDAETNRAFLFRHYWNGALSRAAKEHKLI
jgi:tetratricopeptide (TPR) repeat protein